MSSNTHNIHKNSNPLIQLPITPLESGVKPVEQAKPFNPRTDAVLYKPALELAYPLAIESYKEAERRLDVVEKRLQDLMAFAVTLTLGLIAVLAGKANLQDWPFVIAMSFCVVGLCVGVYGRLMGGLVLISLNEIYEKHLTESDAEFKLAFIGWSGINNKKNADAIRRKANFTSAAAILFLLEGLSLGLWAMYHYSYDRAHSSPVSNSVQAAAGAEPLHPQVQPLER